MVSTFNGKTPSGSLTVSHKVAEFRILNFACTTLCCRFSFFFKFLVSFLPPLLNFTMAAATATSTPASSTADVEVGETTPLLLNDGDAAAAAATSSSSGGLPSSVPLQDLKAESLKEKAVSGVALVSCTSIFLFPLILLHLAYISLSFLFSTLNSRHIPVIHDVCRRVRWADGLDLEPVGINRGTDGRLSTIQIDTSGSATADQCRV
jgi:hypothetical protein